MNAIEETIHVLCNEYGNEEIPVDAIEEDMRSEMLALDYLIDTGNDFEYELYLTNKALILVGLLRPADTTYSIARIDDNMEIETDDYPNGLTFQAAREALKDEFRAFVIAAQEDLDDAADFDECSLDFSRRCRFCIVDSDGNEIDPKTARIISPLL